MDNSANMNNRRSVFLVIENLALIGNAYGNETARLMSEAFEKRLRTHSCEGARWHRVSSAIFALFFDEGTAPLAGGVFEDLWVALAGKSFTIGGDCLLAVPSLHTDLAEARAATHPATALTEQWAAGYRKDMVAAARLVDEIANGHLLHLWQAIRSTRQPEMVLHYEMTAHSCDHSGRIASVALAEAALARIGLSWVHDRAMVLHAVDELEADARPAIAVCLSQLGLCQDWGGHPGIWFSALSRLAARPDVAARLVIDMSEGHGTASLDELRQGFMRFKRLGASISVSGFASSTLTFAHLTAIDPDFVKISPVFLHAAPLSDGARRRLQLLINLASTFARTVIVEGMENEQQLQIALAAKADWAMGALMGQPALSRRWKLDHDCQFTAPLPVAENCSGAEPNLPMTAFG